jgi:DNA-binding transcriptional MerR regulator
MADQLLSIGSFSRASSISVRTLRNYHQSGLLVPAEVDSTTGYRAYSVDQLSDALAIVRLRTLDVPLPMVHRILTARDPATTRTLLAQHETSMVERLAEVERIVVALQDGVPAAVTPAHVFTTNNVFTLERSARVPAASLWRWLQDSGRLLIEAAAPWLADDAVVGALYGPLHDETYEEVTAFVTIREAFLVKDADALRIAEIPSLRWAAMTHTAGFATVSDTYGVLGAWVARNATAHPTAPICELYPAILSPRRRHRTARSRSAGPSVTSLAKRHRCRRDRPVHDQAARALDVGRVRPAGGGEQRRLRGLLVHELPRQRRRLCGRSGTE